MIVVHLNTILVIVESCCHYHSVFLEINVQYAANSCIC